MSGPSKTQVFRDVCKESNGKLYTVGYAWVDIATDLVIPYTKVFFKGFQLFLMPSDKPKKPRSVRPKVASPDIHVEEVKLR